ncbi:hypothetical protein CHUAL_001383 [Chamberlinius hualienensis]
MSVMRFDGLQGQPFWMQNDQLANPSQYCLKSARVDSDRRKVHHRSLRDLNEDPVGASRIMQMDDNSFTSDNIKDDSVNINSSRTNRRRKASSESITRRKRLRLSELDAENRDMVLSLSDEDEAKSSEDDESHHFSVNNKMNVLTVGTQQHNMGINCDNNEMDKDDVEEGKGTVEMADDDEVMNNVEERGRLNQPVMEAKATSLNVSNSCESRRNKRKNFKPRNIVYQYDMCEDGDNELMDEYQLALSNWELSSQQKNLGRNSSPVQRTTSESSHPVDADDYEAAAAAAATNEESEDDCSFEGPESRGRRAAGGVANFDQPLDLSDSASIVGQVKSEENLIFSKQFMRKKSARRYAGPSGEKGPSRLSFSERVAGSPMDLTTARQVQGSSSAYNAASNYAISLTTVSSGSNSTLMSTSTSVNSNGNNSANGGGYRINSPAGGRVPTTSTSVPKSSPSVTGISASLMDLVATNSSKKNPKLAATAAAAQAAALSLAHAVRNREDGHPSVSGTQGMLGPVGILNNLPPNIEDYAEDTMKELLGLYGYNDTAESLSKAGPLPNFISADMLENMSNTLGLLPQASLLPSLLPRSVPTSSSKASTSTVRSHCSSPPSVQQQQGKPSQGFGHMGQLNSAATSPSPTNLAPSTSSQSQAIIPPNMNMILSLAAMQKNKQSDVTSTSPSPTLPTASSAKTTMALSSRARNSASGASSGIFQDSRKSPLDYSRYVKRYVKMRLLRFSSSAECGNNSCKDLNYREHFHCLDCNSRVFIKKEEMIRHFKWHKKRDESLQHGFLRYSPMDDCSEKFPHCAHNRKQTHYHCLMDGCDKCYISTSDVQMHANYHRKDSAIIQEGFQRYRATEDCGLSICAFSGQRTTHFHCRRSGCNFTFKNKADMEKHKTYHIKDEQLNKDGFKKFMKHEGCSFESCRFSRVCNHIHCIRPGCTYVLHSSGQLYSHKRKHERRDNEMAYRKFKLAQSMMRSLGDNQGGQAGDDVDMMKHGDSIITAGFEPGAYAYNEVLQQSFSKYLEAGGNLPLDSPMLPYGMVPGTDPFSLIELSAEFLKARSDDSWRKYLSRYTANDVCKTNCDLIYKDHYHCNAESCSMVFRSKDNVREHARNHELQDQVTDAFYTTVDGGPPGSCPFDCPYQNKQRHYHCGWQNCREIILAVDKPFRRLDHYKIHEYSHKLNSSKEPVPLNITSCSSIDGIFRRKRGRPPKNRTVEFPVTSGSSEYPQAIYTSFKLPKLNNMPLSMSADGGLSSPVGSMGAVTPPVSKNSPSPGTQGLLAGHLSPSVSLPSKVDGGESFQVFPEGAPCTSMMCSFYGKHHYHCLQPRCFYVTDRSEMVPLHWKEVHESPELDLMEGFSFFDRHVDCNSSNCSFNKATRHFHCTQPNCNESFIRYNVMSQHLEMHRNELMRNINEKLYRVNDNARSVTPLSNHKQMLPQVKKEHPLSPGSLCPSTSSRTPSPSNSVKMSNVVKASGTFYPLSAFPQAYKKKEDIKSVKMEVDNHISKDDQDNSWLKKMNAASQHLAIEWKTLLESHVAYSAERSCGRTTCKYRIRDHVHCTYCNQAFPKLSQLQPHLQKHLAPSASSSEVGKGTSAMDDCSDDDFSDHSSDDSDSSSNRFAVNYRNSSPSADSRPPSHSQSYGAFISSAGAANHLPNDMLHTFPNVAEHLNQMSTLANFFNSGGANAPPQDLSSHTQSSVLHPNGTNSHLEMKVERSSPVSTPPGSGAPSSLESYGSNPSSPHLQFAVQQQFSSGGVNKHDTSLNRSGPDDFTEVKKGKMTGLRLLRDEPVPEGYIRYRFNEDCRYTHCGYREHQTHFHCMRKDCGYSFCDKTRFVQHTARHERLDTLMGGDFQQFRAQVACGRSDCIYITSPGSLANKASHFHCLKCEFVCTDTNKVVAHRRQHQKLDSITSAGFEKFTAQQSCKNEGCSHNQRQTHYHCVKCHYAVLGLSQMSAHKYRHLEG